MTMQPWWNGLQYYKRWMCSASMLLCACSTTPPTTAPSYIQFDFARPHAEEIIVAATTFTVTGVVISRYPLADVTLKLDGKVVATPAVRGTLCEVYVPLHLNPAHNYLTISARDVHGSLFQKTYHIINRYK